MKAQGTRHKGQVFRILLFIVFLSLLVPCPLFLVPVPSEAAQLPSVFRGVIVADSQAGVRVVQIEDTAQAARLDLRPEDIIMLVNDRRVRTIDEFAVVSQLLKGQAAQASVIILRNGQPYELTLHVYSLPLLREWGIRFVPDFDLRFVEPAAGMAYWRNLARGFEVAGKTDDAIVSYLNALHHDPAQSDIAMRLTELWLAQTQQQLAKQQTNEALASLNQAVTTLQRLFEEPRNLDELERIKRQLEQTLRALKSVKK